MRIPRAAWWVIAPVAWLWQYLIYIPGHAIWNVVVLYILAPLPGVCLDWRTGMVEAKPTLRPWFIDRLRNGDSRTTGATSS